jgi:CBS domain containing-hemolysin-like protein
MEDPSVTYLFVVVISLILSAFFSGMEIAFLSANRLRIELKSQTGSRKGKILSYYVKNPSRYLSTILVGNNIAIVVYGIFMGLLLNTGINALFNNSFEALQLIVITIISTVIVLITAEFIPKVLFRMNPDYILNLLLYPFQFFFYLLLPIAWSVERISKLVLVNLLGKEISNEAYVFSKVDLDHMISGNNESDENEQQEIDTILFKNALGFGDLKVRECMQPRTEIIAVAEDETPKTLLATFIESGHSKVLVYREDIDHIIGYVHQIDMFKKPEGIKSILIPIPVTNESKLASELLQELISKRKSIAVVVDEFGITAGIITIEDILEEIFGEIDDEYDKDGHKEVKITNLHFIFSARHEIDYLNETYDLQIPEGEYETLGGYIIDLSGTIPIRGSVLQDENWKYMVTKVDSAKLVEVELKKI